MKPSQVARRRASHTVIFGDPKTGKSTLTSELILAGFHLHWISMDNGHEILFKLPISQQELEDKLDLFILPDTKEFPVAIGTCLKIISGKQPVRICDTHGTVDCRSCSGARPGSFSILDTREFGARDILVFDHIGQLANSAMNFITKDEKNPDEFKPGYAEYRTQGALMDRFLCSIQQANFNVICITHSMEVEMEDGKKKLVPLVGTTNFSRNVGKYFDHMIYCEMQNASHKFGSATTYKSAVVTGSRSDVKIEDVDEKKKEKHSLAKFFLAPENTVVEKRILENLQTLVKEEGQNGDVQEKPGTVNGSGGTEENGEKLLDSNSSAVDNSVLASSNGVSTLKTAAVGTVSSRETMLAMLKNGRK